MYKRQVYGSGLFDAENIYEAGRRYIGVGLNLHPCRFRSVMDGLQKKKAVSYTHLDVYKRQALVFLLLMLEEGEIKELLSPLLDEIEKVEGRGCLLYTSRCV